MPGYEQVSRVAAMAMLCIVEKRVMVAASAADDKRRGNSPPRQVVAAVRSPVFRHAGSWRHAGTTNGIPQIRTPEVVRGCSCSSHTPLYHSTFTGPPPVYRNPLASLAPLAPVAPFPGGAAAPLRCKTAFFSDFPSFFVQFVIFFSIFLLYFKFTSYICGC